MKDTQKTKHQRQMILFGFKWKKLDICLGKKREIGAFFKLDADSNLCAFSGAAATYPAQIPKTESEKELQWCS